MRRVAVGVGVACVSAAAWLVPASAGAQERASIVGVVQDASCAVLPAGIDGGANKTTKERRTRGTRRTRREALALRVPRALRFLR